MRNVIPALIVVSIVFAAAMVVGNQHVRGRETERGSSEHSHRARPRLYLVASTLQSGFGMPHLSQSLSLSPRLTCCVHEAEALLLAL